MPTTKKRGKPARINDPVLYAKMSEPHANVDEANAALEKFYAAVQKLRVKHRIADVAVVACVQGGDPAQFFVSAIYRGNIARQPKLLAWALGKAEADVLAEFDSVRRQSTADALAGQPSVPNAPSPDAPTETP